MSKAPDENDKLKAGTLPSDPAVGTVRVLPKPKEAPRILTVQELLEAAAVRALNQSPQQTCTTGVAGLDAATGGLVPGQMWVFGADTNWGKSSFLVMVADENLRAKKRVLIVSSEDDAALYGDRLMIRRARVNAMRFRDRKLHTKEMDAVTAVIAEAEPLPVFLDARGKSAEKTAEQVAWAIKEHAIDVVLYDYLQEFRSSKKHEDRRNEVSDVAATLRHPVKSASKTGILFSQITISATKKYPDKHSIRESRDVSNAADVIVLGFTPEQAIPGKGNRPGVDAGGKCVLVDKVKMGVKGIVPMKWDPRCACFDVVEKQPGEYDELYDGFDSELDTSEERYP